MKPKATKELKPITVRPKQWEEIEKEIIELLRREIYAPLMAELGAPRNRLKNSETDLLEAIATGKIHYSRGKLEGKFSAKTSKQIKEMGGKWDAKTRSWKIGSEKLTPNLKSAIAASESRFNAKIDQINKRLNEVLPEKVASKFSASQAIDKTIYQTEFDFQSAVKNITVAPKLTDHEIKRLRDEYTQNMQLYIKDFTEKEIVSLRKNIISHVTTGGRYESVIKAIQDSYDVSYNKAKFLARQETTLLTTKLAQTRYQSAGINQYRWSCVVGSPNHPVRKMHKALDGKIISWDNPPIVNEKGEKKHAGQDYNCRCKSIPIVRF